MELGNLAATQTGAARDLIALMRRYLSAQNVRWVVLTATQELTNSFRRLGYEPEVLSQAEPSRLVHSASQWGTYYQCNPKVVFFDIDEPRVAH
jgi:hypothetical protein